MYVKTAFLNGYIHEEIYVEQPEGFQSPDNEAKVCKLNKSMHRVVGTCVLMKRSKSLAFRKTWMSLVYTRRLVGV